MPYLSRASRFRFPKTQTRTLRGRLFLARLPEARDEAQEQSGVLAAQAGGERGAGQARDADVEARRLGCHPDLGVRSGQTSAGLRETDSAEVDRLEELPEFISRWETNSPHPGYDFGNRYNRRNPVLTRFRFPHKLIP